MSFFTNIYIVVVETTGQMLESRKWFWERSEGVEAYNDAKSEFGHSRIITLYSFNMHDTIEDKVTQIMGNRHSLVNRPALEELRSNRPAPESEEAVWGELEFRPEGYFYIERTKASTSEYWPYRVERYEVRGDNAWRVIDHTTGTPIGIIGTGTQGEAFKAVVNGYSQTGNFISLKAAVIHVATEYNGV